jgi:hypothetical protein
MCNGNQIALVGFCTPCAAGKAANELHTECADMNDLLVPLTGIAVVEDVLTTNNSNILVEISVICNASHLNTGAFGLSFKRDLATALRLDEAKLNVEVVEQITRSRVQSSEQSMNVSQVTITIDSPRVIEALRDLVGQLEDPTSALRNTPAGALVTDDPPTFAFVCPPGMMRATGAGQCSPCPGNEIPTVDQTACRVCPASTKPSHDQTQCMCEEGLYSIDELPMVACFDMGFVDGVVLESNPTTGCYTCPTAPNPTCLECRADETTRVTLRAGYRFATTDALATQDRHAFKCPVESACPAQVLVVQGVGNDRRLIVNNCTAGHTGLLCAKCLSGWKMSFTGVCKLCSTSWLNPILLIPVAFVAVYFVMRKL